MIKFVYQDNKLYCLEPFIEDNFVNLYNSKLETIAVIDLDKNLGYVHFCKETLSSGLLELTETIINTYWDINITLKQNSL